MQPDLRQRLEDAATESGRSMNAEIVARLESTFANEGVVITTETIVWSPEQIARFAETVAKKVLERELKPGIAEQPTPKRTRRQKIEK